MSNSNSQTTTQNEEVLQLLSELHQDAPQRRRRNLLLILYWHAGRLLAAGNEEEEAKGLLAVIRRQLREAADGSRIRPGECLRFFRAFPERETLCFELSWTHYRRLCLVPDDPARAFYFREARQNHWTARELQRQIDADYYERQAPLDAAGNVAPLKDAYILEFLNGDLVNHHEERALETALLNKLQAFLLELGKGFAFVNRQKRIVTESGKQFYIDLVFYHYILKCFVLFELKAGELSHRDIGQMDMYVRLYEKKYRRPDDRPTLGIILCREKDHTLVQYSMLQDNQQLFAATYSLYLPSRKELDSLFQEA